MIGECFEAELTSEQHKTGHTKAFKALDLPAAGFANGVIGAPWCTQWLEAALGLVAKTTAPPSK